jgi:hypothetical protein
MAEVLQLFSIVRHLYQPDALPIAQLQLDSSQQRLKERYKFAAVGGLAGITISVTGAAPGMPLVLSGGEFSSKGSNSQIPIQQVAFLPNAIDVQVAGDTNSAEEFHQDLVRFLREISDGKKENYPEYAKSVQTLAIVKLNVSVGDLFSDKLNRYMTGAAHPAFELPDAEPHVQLAHLQWIVSYTRNATDYTYEPKLFTLEPRMGTRSEDKIYYTQSPTDSATHLRLLQQLEQALI